MSVNGLQRRTRSVFGVTGGQIRGGLFRFNYLQSRGPTVLVILLGAICFGRQLPVEITAVPGTVERVLVLSDGDELTSPVGAGAQIPKGASNVEFLLPITSTRTQVESSGFFRVERLPNCCGHWSRLFRCWARSASKDRNGLVAPRDREVRGGVRGGSPYRYFTGNSTIWSGGTPSFPTTCGTRSKDAGNIPLFTLRHK